MIVSGIASGRHSANRKRRSRILSQANSNVEQRWSSTVAQINKGRAISECPTVLNAVLTRYRADTINVPFRILDKSGSLTNDQADRCHHLRTLRRRADDVRRPSRAFLFCSGSRTDPLGTVGEFLCPEAVRPSYRWLKILPRPAGADRGPTRLRLDSNGV